MNYYISCFFVIALAATNAYAAPEDLYDYGNSVGNSGWDLSYGHDEELDQDLVEAQRRRKLEELQRLEKLKKEKEKQSDFFGQSVDVYDGDISRSDEDENALKGRAPEPQK